MLSSPTTFVAVTAALLLATSIDRRRRTTRRRLSSQAALDLDARRLGVRRVTPARRWFSTFTLALLEERDASIDDRLTFNHVDHSADRSTNGCRSEAAQLRDLANHFRNRLLAEEGGRVTPTLDHVWVGLGQQMERQLGRRRRRSTTVRLYNAADLGKQGLVITDEVRFAERGGNGGTFRVRPQQRQRAVCVVLVDTERPTSTRLLDALRSPRPVESAVPPLIDNLLVMARNRRPDQATSQDVVDLIQAHAQRTSRLQGAGAWCDVAWSEASRCGTSPTVDLHWATTPPPIDFVPHTSSTGIVTQIRAA